MDGGMNIYLLIIEDRHKDVEVYPYSRPALAMAGFAEYLDSTSGPLTGEDTELNDDMKANGWIAYAVYSTEGDSLRVIRREIDRG